jgi:hypothetical protein
MNLPHRPRAGADVPSRVSKGLEVALFGHVRLAFEGRPFEFGAPRKTLPILAYLLVHRESSISREFLAFLMWPDAEEEVARNNLRRNLTLFKQILPPPDPAESWILATNELVRWNPHAPFTLDIAEFDRLCGDRRVSRRRSNCTRAICSKTVRRLDISRARAPARRVLSGAQGARAAASQRARLPASDRVRPAASGGRSAARRRSARDRGDALSGRRPRRSAWPGSTSSSNACTRISASRRCPKPRHCANRSCAGRRRAPRPPKPARARGRVPCGEQRRASVCRTGCSARARRLLWDQAARGAGAVGFVGGEAGIGKTRFAAELALRAEEQGGRVLSERHDRPRRLPISGVLRGACATAIPLLWPPTWNALARVCWLRLSRS